MSSVKPRISNWSIWAQRAPTTAPAPSARLHRDRRASTSTRGCPTSRKSCLSGASPRNFTSTCAARRFTRATARRRCFYYFCLPSFHLSFHSAGNCADYFYIPHFPPSRDANGRDVGDAQVTRIFSHIRSRYPFWNRTLRAGQARHFALLPCDHGPGDCAFDRPLRPHKYSGRGAFNPVRWARAGNPQAREIERTWGGPWSWSQSGPCT